MKVQAITDRAQTDRDREDADRALAFYKEARTKKKKPLRPLAIILGLWDTENWSRASRELFLLEIRRGLPCDSSIKSKMDYTIQSVEEFYRIRIADMNSLRSGNQGEQDDAA